MFDLIAAALIGMSSPTPMAPAGVDVYAYEVGDDNSDGVIMEDESGWDAASMATVRAVRVTGKLCPPVTMARSATNGDRTTESEKPRHDARHERRLMIAFIQADLPAGSAWTRGNRCPVRQKFPVQLRTGRAAQRAHATQAVSPDASALLVERSLTQTTTGRSGFSNRHPRPSGRGCSAVCVSVWVAGTGMPATDTGRHVRREVTANGAGSQSGLAFRPSGTQLRT